MSTLGLINDIYSFISKYNIEYFNEETTELIDTARANNNTDDTAKEWEKIMREVNYCNSF